MTPGPGIEIGPHWWEASALTTALSLLPHFKQHVERWIKKDSYAPNTESGCKKRNVCGYATLSCSHLLRSLLKPVINIFLVYA